ncbi:iron-sulfur cluster assembly accessory protein [Phormidium sp. LEGE 05292]|uniref:HesB/IscA family protein n=1 Tax=[Phormidium] sp. LEGE 05292 TaxID=767427 RepID=UPI00188141A1|nr:iron-sulfur cluster assembly accessory protein [Phormidium sp. LEGE 05292]MBE9226007.1 iron-sulfur cluster assembly accessory protein [Phormidium sp. LEGE 05292]
MINLSKAAASEVKRLMAKQKQPNSLFRLGVQPGGCAGIYYTVEIERAIASQDQVYECYGIKIVVEEKTLEYINGLTLDYTEDLMGGGFRFHNPNASSSCGCGNSFSVIDTNPLK